jgi:hypothetical protein
VAWTEVSIPVELPRFQTSSPIVVTPVFPLIGAPEKSNIGCAAGAGPAYVQAAGKLTVNGPFADVNVFTHASSVRPEGKLVSVVDWKI